MHKKNCNISAGFLDNKQQSFSIKKPFQKNEEKRIFKNPLDSTFKSILSGFFEPIRTTFGGVPLIGCKNT